MATAYIPREVLTTPGRLPRVCLVCGRPATTEVRETFRSRFIHTDTRQPDDAKDRPGLVSRAGSEGYGCLVLLIYPFVVLSSWLTTTRFAGHSPRCATHSTGESAARLREVTARVAILEGVAEEFAQAIKRMPG